MAHRVHLSMHGFELFTGDMHWLHSWVVVNPTTTRWRWTQKYIYIYINENYLPYCIKLSASKDHSLWNLNSSDIPFIWIVLNVLVLFPCHRCYSWMFLWLFIPEVKIGCVWSDFLGIPLLLNGKKWYFPWYRELSAI